ncbi:uncharacterized protein LOC118435950 [Folsomia candida]|uniref:uncharacterized protein LOC118435950 n=1 Tax=Folsomia candida TaxID=158441 RepID=UPI001604DD5F|nr:uncharacterized protein LOC118435950 [Folsomia candida]
MGTTCICNLALYRESKDCNPVQQGQQVTVKIHSIASSIFRMYRNCPYLAALSCLIFSQEPAYFILLQLGISPLHPLVVLLRAAALVATAAEVGRLIALLAGLILFFINATWRQLHMWGAICDRKIHVGLYFYRQLIALYILRRGPATFMTTVAITIGFALQVSFNYASIVLAGLVPLNAYVSIPYVAFASGVTMAVIVYFLAEVNSICKTRLDLMKRKCAMKNIKNRRKELLKKIRAMPILAFHVSLCNTTSPITRHFKMTYLDKVLDSTASLVMGFPI